MVVESTHTPIEKSAFRKAFDELDNTVRGGSGMTTRERCKHVIKSLCEISSTTFYNWMEHPELVSRNDRYAISIVLDKPIQELFPEKFKH